MSGGQLAVAFIAGGVGFAMVDFLDRYLATYNPSTTTTAPTDRFSGGTGTEANTLNIAMPPSMIRLGAGVGVTLVLGLGAYAVRRNDMALAALQGATVGAGIKVFSMIWNAWVMPKLLKPAATDTATLQASLGARLYPAEITAQQNLANSPQTITSPSGLQPGLAAPPSAASMADVGPFASAPANGGGTIAPAAPVAPAPPQPPERRPMPKDDCGCLGDRLPPFLGFASAA